MKLDLGRLWAMARKEWIQLRRDPRSLILAFVFPVLLLVFFGYAMSWDIDDLSLGVLDHDATPTSRALVATFQASGLFTVTHRVQSHREVEPLLVRGEVKGVLVIPPDFASETTAGRPTMLQLLLDGADANTATLAQGYADAIVAGFSRSTLTSGAERMPSVTLESRVWYNPELRSRSMIVPGLIAVIMSIIAALLTSLTMAREWERGTMEQLISTPVHRLEVVLGKLLPYIFIGGVGVALTAGIGIPLFHVPFRGSVIFLSLQTLLFLVGALGLGLFISAATRTQMLATQVALLATYLPALLLSGFLYDISAMPKVLQAITFLVPARYYIEVTRGVFLKGVGVEALWLQTLLMCAFAAVGLGLAARVFKKEMGL